MDDTERIETSVLGLTDLRRPKGISGPNSRENGITCLEEEIRLGQFTPLGGAGARDYVGAVRHVLVGVVLGPYLKSEADSLVLVGAGELEDAGASLSHFRWCGARNAAFHVDGQYFGEVALAARVHCLHLEAVVLSRLQADDQVGGTLFPVSVDLDEVAALCGLVDLVEDARAVSVNDSVP